MYDWAEFRHFKYLLTILELRGFRAAAEQLNTGQPNLSIQAKQFQENASVRLYEKAKDGRIKPTDTGVAFKFIAKSVLEAREEAFEALAEIERGAITSVRFGCSPLVDQTLFQSFCQMHRELLPSCAVRPERDDTMPLVEDVLKGTLDAAIVTHPIAHTALRIEGIRRDRLVVCLREDDPLASKNTLAMMDLQKHLTILYHPQRHPAAHAKLIELLGDGGVELEEYSRASHPNEMQTLVKDGYGLALIRQGTTLGEGLTTRPIAGVDWTVDTVVIYRQERHPKTLPVLVRKFKRQLKKGDPKKISRGLDGASVRAKEEPTQLTLLN